MWRTGTAGLGGLLPPTSVKWSTIVRRLPTLDRAPSLVRALSLSHTHIHTLVRKAFCMCIHSYFNQYPVHKHFLYPHAHNNLSIPCTQQYYMYLQQQSISHNILYLHTTTIYLTLYPCTQQQSISHYIPAHNNNLSHTISLHTTTIYLTLYPCTQQQSISHYIFAYYVPHNISLHTLISVSLLRVDPRGEGDLLGPAEGRAVGCQGR